MSTKMNWLSLIVAFVVVFAVLALVFAAMSHPEVFAGLFNHVTSLADGSGGTTLGKCVTSGATCTGS